MTFTKGTTMKYEYGMDILYDPSSKNVMIDFRNDRFLLRGPFEDRWVAVAAAEDMCRRKGWQVAS